MNETQEKNGIKVKKSNSWIVNIIIEVVLCVVFIPIILINTVMIIKTYVDPDHIPGVFGVKPVIVLSGSMSPEIETNSLVFVKEVDTDTLKVDDVICYLDSAGVATTHRIVEIKIEDSETVYITKGDANNTNDRLSVSPEQVEGVYIGNIAGLGGFALFMQTTTGMILFIVLPIVLYLAWDIFRRNREGKKEKLRAQELEAELARLKLQTDGPNMEQGDGVVDVGESTEVIKSTNDDSVQTKKDDE